MKKILPGVDLASMVIISGAFGILIWVSYCVFRDGSVHIYAENSLIENLQACALASACIVYLVTAVFEKRSDKLIIVFCSLLCLAFLLRELDIENFDLPHALILIGSGAGRNAILIVAFLVVLVCAFLKLSHYMLATAGFVKSRPGWLLITGGVFLLIGQFFEKSSTIFNHHVFLEEINEFVGYVLILLSSIAANAFMNGMKIRASGT